MKEGTEGTLWGESLGIPVKGTNSSSFSVAMTTGKGVGKKMERKVCAWELPSPVRNPCPRVGSLGGCP